MIEKTKLHEYARKLMFEMKEEEYLTLQKEFEVILKQMDLIGKINDIKDIEPMTFPFDFDYVDLREDIPNSDLKVEDVLINAKEVSDNKIKVPRVVE